MLYFAVRDVSPKLDWEDEDESEEGESDIDSDSDDYDFEHPSRSLMPLLVCKTFLVSKAACDPRRNFDSHAPQRLGIPYLYENPVLESSWAMRAFRQRLVEQPSLGLHVRRLFIDNLYYAAASSDFETIIPCTTGLVALVCNDFPITWKIFDDLGVLTGTSLCTLEGVSVATCGWKAEPAVFSRFPQMRSFTWDCETAFKTGPNSIPGGTFNNLVDLTVKQSDPSFLTVLSQLE